MPIVSLTGSKLTEEGFGQISVNNNQEVGKTPPPLVKIV